MPQAFWTLQSNLNRGELDPLLAGRKDLQAYYNGVEAGLNTLIIPQGGLKKRPGMEYIATALGNGRTENFSFSVDQNYLLVFTDLRMQIFKSGVLQTNINASGFDYLVTPWTLAQIADFDYSQSVDTIIICHPDVQTRTITRSSDTTWTIANAPFTNIPTYDFNDASSPAAVSEIQTLTFSLTVAQGDRFKLKLEDFITEELIFSSDFDTNEENIRKALQGLPNTGNSGITVAETGGFGFAYVVTFAGESANAWNFIQGTIIYSFDVTTVLGTARDQVGTARFEDAWSATRGWPRTSTFHEGRLWIGGSSSLPARIWGSRVFDQFDFDKGKNLDDDAVESLLDTDQVNAVEAIFSNRTLQIFTNGGEFYVPSSPITPENVSAPIQSNLGSRRVRPITIDGVTLFPQRTGKAIIQFVFMDEFKSNQSRSVSILASHLIKTPIKLAASRGTEETDANYVYILNDDGTMAVFNSLLAEDISGFTPWETDGDIKSVAVVDDEVNLMVERVINGVTTYHLEKENSDLNTDAAVLESGTAAATVSNLGHLEGETVWGKADGAFMGTFVVSGGQITFNRTATLREAGLAYVPQITTMPLNVNLATGPNAAKRKKIKRASIQYYLSNGIIINGHKLADKTIGQNQFDPPTPQSGLRRISILGWSLEAQVTITQETPMPLTILNIGLEVVT